MIDKQKVMNEFSGLAYADKKQKLLDLFVLFEGNSKVIQETKPFLIADKLSEEQIVTYYGYLVEIITSLNEEDLMKSVKWLDRIHQQLVEIQRQEQAERAQEDPESLLQNM